METSKNIFRRNSDLVLAFFIIGILLLLIVPIQGVVLDTLVATSIALSLTTLLVTLYSENVVGFSSFPSFLLFITLFRLGLNIATTRTILTEGHAGHIIQTFGELVTGGNTFVGFLLFLLLTGVNFIVITKGASRIAEVAARFILDSLPGKQLAIDADVHAGLIDEEEAKVRRDKVMAEADFYGAMDGASRFVRGDAIAGIVITFINVIGSFFVGLVLNGMSFGEIVHVYVTMIIGDGLVTQIPALLVSVGAGIMVTRSSSRENLSESLRKQLFENPRVLFITATTLLILGLIPGMPFLILGALATAIFFYANSVRKRSLQQYQVTTEKKIRKGEELEEGLSIDPMSLELGVNLSSLASQVTHDNLLQQISSLRKQLALDLGIVTPSIRIQENTHIGPDAYQIKIKGNQVAMGQLVMQKEPLLTLTTHLTEVIRRHAHELLNRQDVSRLLDNVRENASVVIDELIPVRLKLGQVMHVLQNLLREQISIRDIVSILEGLADSVSATNDIELLTESVRQKLGRLISHAHIDKNQVMQAILLDPKMEEMLLASLQKSEGGSRLILHPTVKDNIIQQIHFSLQHFPQAVFLTITPLRPSLRKLVAPYFPGVCVLSLDELTSDIKVQPIGTLQL